MNTQSKNQSRHAKGIASIGAVATVAIAGTLLALGVSADRESANPAKKFGEDAANKIWQGVDEVVPFDFGSPFGDHPDVDGFKIKGKWVYVLDLKNEDGSRATNNFDQHWDGGTRKFKVYVAGVDNRALRARMAFQRKGDKDVWGDSDRGGQFRHNSTTHIDGGDNYLAQRNFDWTDELEAQYPYAMVIFLEDGLSYDEFWAHFEGE